MLEPPEVDGEDGTSRGPLGGALGAVRGKAEPLGRLDFGTADATGAEATGNAPPEPDGLTTTPPGVLG
jgi:hypothetical protein